MVKKRSFEIPDLVEEQTINLKIEDKENDPETLQEEYTNHSVKAEMAKELRLSNFSYEAIGRLLHLSENEVENILKISEI